MAAQQQQVTNLHQPAVRPDRDEHAADGIQTALTDSRRRRPGAREPLAVREHPDDHLDQLDAGRRHRDLQQRRGRRRLPGLGHRRWRAPPRRPSCSRARPRRTRSRSTASRSRWPPAPRPHDLVNAINSNSNAERMGDRHRSESSNGGPAAVVLSDRQTGGPRRQLHPGLRYVQRAHRAAAVSARAGHRRRVHDQRRRDPVLVLEHDQRRFAWRAPRTRPRARAPRRRSRASR